MTTPIRYSILTALESTLEGITVAGGYNNTVATCAIEARAWGDREVRANTMPYVAIIPNEEAYIPQMGHMLCDWTIDILAHANPAAKTPISMALKCAELREDIRKALAVDPKLGTENVISTTIKTGRGTEGSVAAAQEGVASVLFKIVVRFWEDNP